MNDNFNEVTKDLLNEDGLRIDESNSKELKDAATWSRSIAILTIVFIALALLISLISPLRYLTVLAGETYVMVVAVACLAVVGTIVYSLNQFGNNMRNAVDGEDQDLFEKGAGNLKLYMIVLCICVALSFISSLYSFFNTINTSL